MLFSSVSFLYFFLPATLVLYFIAPRRFKNTVLLICSLFFYGWGEPKFVLLMLCSITQAYFFGRLTEKYRKKRQGKLFLALSVVLSLAALGYFKYAGFFVDSFRAVFGIEGPALSIALPIGISFYTFQAISYVIDVYRGDARAQKNFIDLALYIAMFPQLIAGPIVRYTDIEPELKERKTTADDLIYGVRRFVIGLGKKLLIANLLGELAAAFVSSSAPTVLFAWMYAIAYAMQVYFDFSAYSDMAIGLGRIFGFRFPENFNYPFVSKSITEFWRRWHISLGSWFRDYLYIPLGGSRGRTAKLLRNLLIVWAATGLWHGAAWNFVAWGLFYAVLLGAEKLLFGKALAKHRLLGHVYTLFFVVISFVIFDAPTLAAAVERIGFMFGAGALPIASAESIYLLKSYAVILIIAAVASTGAPKALAERCSTLRYIEPVAMPLLLILCTAYLVDGSFNPFLYFRF